ncbi:MAG: polysaccharide biosynthesis/export family protein [Geminicoccaceae bacterium]
MLLPIVALAGIATLVACASSPTAATAPVIASETSAETLATAYNLDAGDQIRIIVFHHVDLSGEFVPDDGDNLALPPRKLESQIEEAFKHGDLLVDPQVGIEMLSDHPFYILSEFNQPGSYPYVSDMTETTVVALAGGFTDQAPQSSMAMQRHGDDGRLSVGLARSVLPGDMLNIEERFFR